MTVWCCEATSTVPIGNPGAVTLKIGPGKASLSRMGIPALGNAWLRSIQTSQPALPIFTRAGKSPTGEVDSHGYACLRVDSAVAAALPDTCHFSPRETKDFYDCIEWAGVSPGAQARSP